MCGPDLSSPMGGMRGRRWASKRSEADVSSGPLPRPPLPSYRRRQGYAEQTASEQWRDKRARPMRKRPGPSRRSSPALVPRGSVLRASKAMARQLCIRFSWDPGIVKSRPFSSSPLLLSWPRPGLESKAMI